jgi:fatty acid amide hydrolase
LICYYTRSITVGKNYNLIAGIESFEKCLKMAIKCDNIRRSTPQEKRDELGLLFGIPISVKESFEQEGFDCALGMSAKLNNPMKEDGGAIKLLRKQGAIPFVRSNVPQQLATLESVNLIWGRAKNP